MAKHIDPIIKKEFYCLIAPDGTPQLSSICCEIVDSYAYMTMLSEAGIGMSLDALRKKGFTFEKVIVTIVQVKKQPSKDPASL